MLMVARWVKAGITMLTLSTDGGLLTAGAGLFLAEVDAAAGGASGPGADNQ